MNLDLLLGSRRPPPLAQLPVSERTRSGAVPVKGRATPDLREALLILADEMHDALSCRRTSEHGTESFARADERVAHVLELFGALQRGMAIPGEIWQLPLRPLDRAVTFAVADADLNVSRRD